MKSYFLFSYSFGRFPDENVLKIFAAVLVVTTFFIFFGGHLLFTSSNPYLTGVFCALVLSVLIYTF